MFILYVLRLTIFFNIFTFSYNSGLWYWVTNLIERILQHYRDRRVSFLVFIRRGVHQQNKEGPEHFLVPDTSSLSDWTLSPKGECPLRVRTQMGHIRGKKYTPYPYCY